MNWYSNFLGRHPYIIVISTVSLFIVSLMTSLLAKNAPNFSDPQLGFEARGTEISMRLTTWNNLMDASKPSGSLTVNHEEFSPKQSGAPPLNDSPTPQPAHLKASAVKAVKTYFPHKYYNDVNLLDSEIGRISAWVPDNATSQKYGATDLLAETLEEEDDWASSKRSETVNGNIDDDYEGDASHSEEEDHNHLHVASDGFFCEGLGSSYSHVVITRQETSQSLFNLQGLLSACQLQNRLVSGASILGNCQTIKSGKCCHPWSLPNYVALLRNRTSCENLTDDDVTGTLSLLSECKPYFINGTLEPFCEDSGKCELVPLHCRKHNTVYNIFQYITDINFDPANGSLHSSMIFLPVARSAAVLPYFLSISGDLQTRDYVTAVAADFGAKGALFDDCLRRDIALITGGVVVILLCLWSYTGSLFLTICTILAVAMTLVIAYFIYTFVFAINFFPFMNLLGVVIAIGIGADDAFILCKIWQCVKLEEGNTSTDKLVDVALRSAALSMSVTSLTTAAALFSNCVSPITAINCFSIYSGTAVLVNFLLMVSWLPACIFISEDWCLPSLIPIQWRPALNARLQTMKVCTGKVQTNVERYLVLTVIRPRFLWVLLFGGLALGASYVAFIDPKLRLPDSKTFLMFESRHPFEVYDSTYRNLYWFERQAKEESPVGDSEFMMPLRFIWGVDPVDNGNFMDPASRGSLQFNPQFNAVAKESQEWLLRFCQKLRLQPFYKPTFGPLLANCYIETFKSWMSRRCKDGVRNMDRSPCCESSKFPFSQRVFNLCITQAVASLHATPRNIFQPGAAGPKFAKGKRGEIKAIVVEFDSNHTYSNSFDDILFFYETVEEWFKGELQTAPPGLRNGWFVSELGFYDLQLALSAGTSNAMLLSIFVAFVVAFITTLNVTIAIFSVITISAIIFVTVGILILLGWKLNILESVAVTTAIGLSVDFSLHYGLHYRLAGNESRQCCTVHALSRMAGPTAMGAVTTGAAGVFMLLSSVLPYIQIGILVVVLMTVSWFYSTFFLMALLSMMGPQDGCGQFTRPSPASWCRAPADGKPPGPAMWSESTLSTSSCPAELHELDALTRGPRRSRRPRSQSPALPDEMEIECGGISPS